jgi:dephospho-CoA kinase
VLKIGLTGGIGSGKSTVSQIFEVLGIPVFDADREAKRLMEENEDLRKRIQQELGTETYTNNKLNRRVLADLVFTDAYKLDKLNAIVHPAVISFAEEWMKKQSSAFVVKEAALLFEAGSAGDLDYVIGVYAPQHLRIHRVIKRDGMTPEQVMDRMSRQINEEMKMRLCDFVLNNDEQQLLITQVLKLHNRFLQAQH